MNGIVYKTVSDEMSYIWHLTGTNYFRIMKYDFKDILREGTLAHASHVGRPFCVGSS